MRALFGPAGLGEPDPWAGPLAALGALLLFLVPGQLVWLWLLDQGIVTVPRGADGQPLLTPSLVEWGLLLQGLNCLCVLGYTRLAPLDVGLRLRGTRLALLGYGAFFVVWLPVCLLLYLWVMRNVGVPVQAQDHLLYFAAPEAARPGLYYAIFLAVALGPLAEEVVFRGYLQGALRRVMGPHGAVWLAALVFGVLHGFDKAIPLGALGVLFGYLRERTGSLWAPYLAHALHNALTVTVTMAWPSHLQELYS